VGVGGETSVTGRVGRDERKKKPSCKSVHQNNEKALPTSWEGERNNLKSPHIIRDWLCGAAKKW